MTSTAKNYIAIPSPLLVICFWLTLIGLNISLPNTYSRESQARLIFTRSGLVIEIKPKITEVGTVAVAVNELVIKPIQIYQREKKTIICLSLYSWQAGLAYHIKIYHKSDSRLIAEHKA